MWKGEIHCSHCLQLNLDYIIPSSFTLPSFSSAKRPIQWFWDPNQLSAKPDTTNKQLSIAKPEHMGSITQSCAPGHGQLCMRLFRASLSLPVLFPFLRAIQQSLLHHLPTCHGAHRNPRRSSCVLWKWAVRGDCSLQEIPLTQLNRVKTVMGLFALFNCCWLTLGSSPSIVARCSVVEVTST